MRKPLINPGIIKRLKSFFAIIQDTDTATRYIPAGKYVLYKNIACHASHNIESGDTLALGTNLVTDSDGFVNCLNDGLGGKVNTSDIVNSLTSTDSTKPLSAAQGKVLNDTLTTLNSNVAKVIVDIGNITTQTNLASNANEYAAQGTKMLQFSAVGALAGDMPQSLRAYGTGILNLAGYYHTLIYCTDAGIYCARKQRDTTSWKWVFMEGTEIS